MRKGAGKRESLMFSPYVLRQFILGFGYLCCSSGMVRGLNNLSHNPLCNVELYHVAKKLYILGSGKDDLIV
ncbi:hypothetical protein L6452_20497 [Arctium lappa]|uniref:Uncharacterized protein n=1 Tax=Arctium lappa TaxID=4217 RepID=A0ACB9BCC3_ARCLA|nr:hypothetical protein L6452_20497 [Arctium lappa]